MKTIVKSIKLNENENKELEKMLTEHNVTFSRLVKSLLFSKNNNIVIPQKMNNFDKDFLSEFNRIGNNLNQLTKKVNVLDKSEIDTEYLLIAITEIRDELKELKDFRNDS